MCLVWYVKLLKLVKYMSSNGIVDDEDLQRFMKFHKFNRGLDYTHHMRGWIHVLGSRAFSECLKSEIAPFQAGLQFHAVTWPICKPETFVAHRVAASPSCNSFGRHTPASQFV